MIVHCFFEQSGTFKVVLEKQTEQEPCEDTVNKQAVISTIYDNTISEDATNGDMIKAMFPNADIEYWAEYSTYNVEFPNDNDVKHFSYDWWNAPYKAESEEEE